VADPRKQAPSQYVLPLQIGSSATKGVCINGKEPPKLGSAGAPPPCDKGVADSKKYARPHMLSYEIWSFYVKRYQRC